MSCTVHGITSGAGPERPGLLQCVRDFQRLHTRVFVRHLRLGARENVVNKFDERGPQFT